MGLIYITIRRVHIGVHTLPFCHLRLKARKSSKYPVELKTLGDHLRKKRLDEGLLIKDLAEILGVQVESVSHWENNRLSPQLRFIPRIIHFLGYIPYDMKDKTVGEQMLICQSILGETHEDLAKRLGVCPGTVLRWINNQSTPTPKCLHALELLLDYITNEKGLAMSSNTNLPAPIQHRTS